MKYGEDRLNDLLEAPLWNIAQSFYDQYVEANVRFRQNSGFRMKIIRRQVAKCCDWCANLSGIYWADEAPDDIYRRHDNCRCMVTTTTEKGGYKDVWSKKEFQTQREARKARIKDLEVKDKQVANKTISVIIKTEKNLDEQPSNSIKRSIRKIEKSKKEHEDKIRNPKKYIEDWDDRDERYRDGMIRYWKKEIIEKDRAIKRRKEKLRERGESYE